MSGDQPRWVRARDMRAMRLTPAGLARAFNRTFAASSPMTGEPLTMTVGRARELLVAAEEPIPAPARGGTAARDSEI